MEADFAREMTARAHALLQMPAQRGLDLRDGKEDEEMTGGVSSFHFFCLNRAVLI